MYGSDLISSSTQHCHNIVEVTKVFSDLLSYDNCDIL